MEFLPGQISQLRAIIQGKDEGREPELVGRVVVRSRTEIEQLKVVRNKSSLLKFLTMSIRQFLLKKSMMFVLITGSGVAEVRDESDRTGLRIAIELKKVLTTNILNTFLKYTDLRVLLNFNIGGY